MTTVKALLGYNTAHLEPRRGTAQQASDYCKKDDTRAEGTAFREFGEMKATAPGARTDLLAFKDAVVVDHKRKRDLVEDHFVVLAKYPKFYDTLLMLDKPQRTVDLQVTLLYGETGTGKTRHVQDLHGTNPEFFIVPLANGTMWYDTYDRHKIVLIDDFAGAASHVTLTSLLRLLDRYPLMVPVKGSHTWWLPDHIYVTSNIMPRDWYKWTNRQGQYDALARRFTDVWCYVQGTDRVQADEAFWTENRPSENPVPAATLPGDNHF